MELNANDKNISFTLLYNSMTDDPKLKRDFCGVKFTISTKA
jgi:hypothetical protein